MFIKFNFLTLAFNFLNSVDKCCFGLLKAGVLENIVLGVVKFRFYMFWKTFLIAELENVKGVKHLQGAPKGSPVLKFSKKKITQCLLKKC